MISQFTPRRDFLKILIGATGASFLTLPLGCSEKDASNAMRQISPQSPSTLLKRQRFTKAHSYIRDKNALPFGSSRKLDCDVLIIGAGASGLSSAISLKQQGYNVLVVENENRAGGTGVNGVWNGIKYPYGSVYFVTYDGDIKALCETAGVTPIIAPEDAVLYKNELYSDIWSDTTISSLPIAQSDKEGMRKFRDYLLIESNIPSYPIADILSPDIAKLDSMSGRNFLQQFTSPFTEDLLDLYAKSSMGAGIDSINTFCLLNFYNTELGISFEKMRYTFPGGMNELYAGLAKTIGDEYFLYDYLAIESKNTAKGVQTICIGNNDEILEIHSKYTLMAGNKQIASRICSDLPQKQIIAMNSLQYPPYATIHIHSTQELFPNEFMDIWTIGTNNSCTDILSSNALRREKSPTNSFVYSVYGALPSDKRSMMLDDIALAEYAYNTISSIATYLDNNMMHHISEIECFAWGHSLVIPAVGTHSGIAQLSRTAIGNILFSSSDNDATSSLENAVYYGLKSSEIIGKKLKY